MRSLGAVDMAPVVYERYPGAAATPLPATHPGSGAPEPEPKPAAGFAPPSAGYYRRRPERTALYEAVRANLETFLFEAAGASGPGGHGYPRFVEHEFRRLLACGIPAHGFAEGPTTVSRTQN